ncbi:MAG: alkaline phosphatase family protein [Candidatus Eisenbacteria bacterium]|nr:alkaline phosphatase family protein [Candidatus Eisenbacteria bacterium]
MKASAHHRNRRAAAGSSGDSLRDRLEGERPRAGAPPAGRSKAGPLAIILLVDGARPDVLEELLAAGELPHIQEEIAGPGSVRRATSCLPSTTGPAHLPFLTGCYPGTLNIPGIRWLDKQVYGRGGVWDRQSFRSYNGVEALYMNRDLPRERKTIFELAERPFAIYSLLTRGLSRGRDLTRFVKPWLYLRAHLTDRWHPIDRVAEAKMLACLDDDPDFLFAVFPAVDSFSHLRHPRDPETIAAYHGVDRSVGKLVADLKRRGRWDETLLVITSDHGLTPTTTHLDLARFLDGRGLRTLSYPVVWKRKPATAVMISGNAVGKVYFLGNGGACLEGDAVPGALGDVWPELMAREEVDFSAWREGPERIRIASPRGNALVVREARGLCYRPETGDPFHMGGDLGPFEDAQSLAATHESDYPDALVQLFQFFGSPRSGDLVVVSRNGSDLREAFEWPEHRSSHGSLHREHMSVPLIANRRGWDPRPARTVDLFPSVLRWLGKPQLENIDGRALF